MLPSSLLPSHLLLSGAPGVPARHSPATGLVQVLVVLLGCLFFGFSPMALAQQRQAPEAELKASILVNMLLFVDWPARTRPGPARLSFCYLSDSPVAVALEALDGRPVRGRSLNVQRVGPERIGECDALYLGEREQALLARLGPMLGSAPVLIFSDSSSVPVSGVMVNLDVVAGRVIFDVDLRSVRRSGLGLSSQVLRLARSVQE